MLVDSVVARFRAADRNTRLETLLDYSRKLRDLPAGLQATSGRERQRVANPSSRPQTARGREAASGYPSSPLSHLYP